MLQQVIVIKARPKHWSTTEEYHSVWRLEAQDIAVPYCHRLGHTQPHMAYRVDVLHVGQISTDGQQVKFLDSGWLPIRTQ
jgi:hypothetical protein